MSRTVSGHQVRRVQYERSKLTIGIVRPSRQTGMAEQLLDDGCRRRVLGLTGIDQRGAAGGIAVVEVRRFLRDGRIHAEARAELRVQPLIECLEERDDGVWSRILEAAAGKTQVGSEHGRSPFSLTCAARIKAVLP